MGEGKERRITLIMIIVFTVLYGLALLPAAGFALMSPMMSDSGANTAVYILIYSALSLPITLIAGIALPWIFFFVKRYRWAKWACFLPFVSVCGFVTGFLAMLAMDVGA